MIFKKIKYGVNDEIYKRKWHFMCASSSLTGEKISNTILFSEVDSYLKNDVLDDIKLILNRLKKAGLKRAIVVDLTDPD